MSLGSASNFFLGAASATGGGGYEIERSLRFNSADTAYLNRTPSSAGNRRTFTWSGWCKRSKPSNSTIQYLFATSNPAGNDYSSLFFGTSDNLTFQGNNGSGSVQFNLISSAVYRDVSAWYHIVLSVDSTQSTSSDRIKLYVNGQQIDSFGTETYPPQDFEFRTNSTEAHGISYSPNFTTYFDGYLAEVHFIDGQALAASDFGEYNDNNIWQPKEFNGTFGPLVDQSQTWSTYGSPSSGGFSLAAQRGFNGDVNNQTEGDTSGAYFSIPFSTTIASGDVGFVSYASGGSGHMKLYNGATEVDDVTSSGNSQFRYSTYAGAITEIRISRDSRAFEFAAVSVFGKVLVDAGYSYTNNSFKLNFSDNTSTTTIAEDSSGNNNDWTANNISVSPGADNDSLLDSPTNYNDGTNVGGNFCTWNPLDMETGVITLSEGNLKTITTSSTGDNVRGTFGFSSGKWYWECTVTNFSGGFDIGFATPDWNITAGDVGNVAYSWSVSDSGTSKAEGTNVGGATDAFNSAGKVIGIAFDADAGSVKYYIDGVDQGVIFSGLDTSYIYIPAIYLRVATTGGIWNFGQRPYTYSAPTGYKGICTQNLSNPTIANGSTAFNTAIWTGDGTSGRNIPTGHSSDLVWLKRRDTTNNFSLTDIIRGVNVNLRSSTSGAETTDPNSLTSFDTDGFTVGSDSAFNGSGGTFVGWSWDAGSSTGSNTDGTITSQVRANTSAGFSIVSYTADATSSQTIGHGLNAKPGLIIVKDRDAAINWSVYHQSLDITAGEYLKLNTTEANLVSNSQYNSTEATTSVFTVGYGGNTNYQTGNEYIAYCFAPVEGYSAFGSYEGNGSTDGPFVFTGFRPAFVMIKNTDAVGDWSILDTARDPFNLADNYLLANSSGAEGSPGYFRDYLSNGFKIRDNGTGVNTLNQTYIYVAFAEHPLKTARAR